MLLQEKLRPSSAGQPAAPKFPKSLRWSARRSDDQGVFNTHPTRLSEATRHKLANVLAAILIAIIVVCVIVVVWTLIQNDAISSRPGSRSTSAPTATMPNRPSVYYRTCAEAHAAGRWDIPEGDPAYRPGLDKDHNGIACESRKTSRLADR
ncbi:excalibur calcium-binding domain-containing protein [Mycobacterium sp. WUMAC-025]|uniref:excalibur calcium-binding domain-containing protein n=2 Tax=unclassified Mycobacterium TaxID=2642494 RepID=UPI0027E01437|nr:excalibur calcium-binding domain-containing protein [Mycobacterium sp. WUMAC-025]